MNKLLSFSLILIVISACLPPKHKEITEVSIDLKDPVYRKIINFQDRQELDSLYGYFKHYDPSYRYAAAMAFGSIRTKESINSIFPLLRDRVAKVRVAAAFALGQIGDVKAQDSLIASFNAIDTLAANNELNASILIAVGKCANEKYLKPITTVSTYRLTDTLLLYGQARAIYNYSLRDITTPSGTEKMIDFLGSSIYPESVRLIAASYTKRAKNIDLHKYKFRLNKIFLSETNPDLKMDVAIALGKTKDSDVLRSLLKELKKENDYRVKINILRALGNFTYIDVIEPVIEELKNPNIHIAKTAAQYLIDHGQPNDVIIYRKYTRDNLPWQVRSKIFEAIIKHIPAYFSKTKSASIWDIQKSINSSSNPYEKAAYIKALSHDFKSLKLIRDLGFDANEIPARTAAVEALNTIISKPDLDKSMGRYQFKKFRKVVAEMIQQAFESEDMGMVALAAIGFSSCSFELKDEYENLAFIKEAKNKLTLPKDIESYNEVIKLESQLANKPFKPVVLDYNHPIDWKVFDALGATSKAVVETNKGVFEISFFADNAPGSVVNFISLAEDNYFEGKRFHRVVPNFVIQTGCSRGDGFGGLDYSIRSELTQMSYNAEGFVGMASAGNHTESTQWFVTHSPAIHLDGNYSIFGRITKGMDIVHTIEVGDIVQSIKIIY